MNETKNNKEGNNGRCWLVIVLILCAIMLLFYCIDVTALCSKKCAEWGNFIGGVVGTIIAGIACIYVYKTYISQKKELEKTNETAVKQQFETTFFNLISNYKNILNTIHYTQFNISYPLNDTVENIQKRIEIEKKRYNGTLSAEELREHYTKEEKYGGNALYEIFKNNDMNCADDLCDYYYHPWFANICLILRYIEGGDKCIDKQFYMDFFTTQITRAEWWLLYGIFLYGKKFASDTVVFNNYVDLFKRIEIFNYGFNYILEKYDVFRNKPIKHD
ncbi:MAG: hypothetical protein J6T98_06730 [Salinivirgaceae bacterium]|nr:hypothetical protein [Salinivirgaceae bacterium]